MRTSDVISTSRRNTLKYFFGLVGAHYLIDSSSAQSQGVTVEETPSMVTIENNRIRLKLSRETGGIVQIEDVQNGVKIRDPDGPNSPKIWHLAFYTEEFSSLFTADTTDPSIQVSENENGGKITLKWDNPSLFTSDDSNYNREFDASITVTVRLEPDSDDLVWNFDLENRDSLAIRQVQFPLITDISEIDPTGQDKLVLPIMMGREISNPTETNNWYTVRYPSGLGTMQFSAFTNSSGGFFIQSRDNSGYIKRFNWGTQGEDVNLLKFYHQFDLPKKPGTDGAIPYELTIGAFSGDWHDAADRYKSWLDSSGLLPSGTMDIPDWYYDIGATIRADSYSRYGNGGVPFNPTIERVIQTREALGTPIQFIWWGYQTHGYFGYGDWFPPKEGWNSFTDSIDRLTANDIAPVGFVGGVKLHEKSDVFQNRPKAAKKWLKRDKGQKIKSVQQGGLTTYFPHFTNDEWNNIILEACRTWVEEGAKQIQIDGMPWGSLPDFGDHVCYDPDHDHPVGAGGNWWPNESKLKLEHMRKEVRQLDETVLLSGEGISEYHLPELDIQHTRDVFEEQKGRYREESNVIPLTQYVLGDHLLVRGVLHKWLLDYDHSQPPRYLRLGLARSLKWGALPNIRIQAHQNLPPFGDELIEYASRIAKLFKVHGQRFVTDGDLLREPPIDSPAIPVAAITGHLADGEQRQFSTDALHTSAWMSSDAKETAVILTNIDDHQHSVNVDLTSAPFSGDSDRIYYTVINGQYDRQDFTDSAPAMELNLAQDDVILIVSAPSTDSRENALEQLIAAQKSATADQQDNLLTAKQAFVNGEFTHLQELTTEITESATTSSIEKNGDSATSSPIESPSETSNTDVETDTTTPGFGISTGVSAIAGVGYLLKNRLSPNEDD